MDQLRTYYNQLWIREGIELTNEHQHHYFERSMKIPALIIDGIAHFCFIFPGKDSDYQINCKGHVKQA